METTVNLHFPRLQQFIHVCMRQYVPCTLNQVNFDPNHLAKDFGICATLPILRPNVNLAINWNWELSSAC
jgi:hypothetical protein